MSVVGENLVRTPVIPWTGTWPPEAPPVLLKCENLQQSGSFKARGATWFLSGLTPAERGRGLVTVSAGNHALGLAWAAHRFGCRAVVVMPEGSSPVKQAGVRELGGDVILQPDALLAFEEARRLSKEEGMVFVHPFDDPRTIAGQATLTLELLQQVPDMDLLVMGVGGGGLLSGASLVLEGSACRLVAVEPESAATLTRALEAGAPVTLPRASTIAEGLAPPYVGNLNFEIIRRKIDGVRTIEDPPIRRAVRLLFERAHLVVEPSGAAAMAALIENLVDVTGARRPVCVLSGGNVTLEDLARHAAA
jgi:threonine dehydratase